MCRVCVLLSFGPTVKIPKKKSKKKTFFNVATMKKKRMKLHPGRVGLTGHRIEDEVDLQVDVGPANGRSRGSAHRRRHQ